MVQRKIQNGNYCEYYFNSENQDKGIKNNEYKNTTTLHSGGN